MFNYLFRSTQHEENPGTRDGSYQLAIDFFSSVREFAERGLYCSNRREKYNFPVKFYRYSRKKSMTLRLKVDCLGEVQRALRLTQND
jgi:hypothetical protein